MLATLSSTQINSPDYDPMEPDQVVNPHAVVLTIVDNIPVIMP
jgi:hypothetical protein